jgi:uncharacterized damage-inducible protein DinB
LFNAHPRLTLSVRRAWDGAGELVSERRTNHRINLILIDAISEEGMGCTLSKRGGRDVARQFAHLHNVRIWQLERRAKDLAEGLVTFESKDSPSKDRLKEALSASASGVEQLLAGVLDGDAGRKGFKKGIFTTLSYFVAHESHHRGSILLTLKQSGHAVPKDVAFGIWDWDRR